MSEIHIYSDCPENKPIPELARIRLLWLARTCRGCLRRQWLEA